LFSILFQLFLNRYTFLYSPVPSELPWKNLSPASFQPTIPFSMSPFLYLGPFFSLPLLTSTHFSSDNLEMAVFPNWVPRPPPTPLRPLFLLSPVTAAPIVSSRFCGHDVPFLFFFFASVVRSFLARFVELTFPPLPRFPTSEACSFRQHLPPSIWRCDGR